MSSDDTPDENPESNISDSSIIDNQIITASKPYLGGYWNKLTGKVYHHAKVQTDPPPWKYPIIERFCRETQTADFSVDQQQTVYDVWTQTEVPHFYLYPNEEHSHLPSGRYISADEIKKKKLDAIVVIQKYWRRWIALQKRKEIEADIRKHMEWDAEQVQLREDEEAKWLEDLEQRKKHPYSNYDFTLLLSDIDKWYKQEVDVLKANESGAHLKASLYVLTNEEICKLQALDNEKGKIQAIKKLERNLAFLTKTASDKKWPAYGGIIPVQTPGTLKARYLKELYRTLSKINLLPQDRIAALMELKKSVKDYNSTLTDNLISLANREIDLLERKTKAENLSGLRMRIRNLFWQFVCLPDVNPEANISQVHSSDGQVKHIIACRSCNQFYILPKDTLEEAAYTSVMQQKFAKCSSCKYLENEGWIRRDLEVYKRMLKLLQMEEEKKDTASEIIYLLQPHDICYMVEKIWQSQSCISGLSTLKDLELTRWNPSKKWTPWNSILVTRTEAQHHSCLHTYKEMYDKKFRRSIYLKHMAARQYISSIPRFLPHLDNDFDFVEEDDDDE